MTREQETALLLADEAEDAGAWEEAALARLSLLHGRWPRRPWLDGGGGWWVVVPEFRDELRASREGVQWLWSPDCVPWTRTTPGRGGSGRRVGRMPPPPEVRAAVEAAAELAVAEVLAGCHR